MRSAAEQAKQSGTALENIAAKGEKPKTVGDNISNTDRERDDATGEGKGSMAESMAEKEARKIAGSGLLPFGSLIWADAKEGGWEFGCRKR